MAEPVTPKAGDNRVTINLYVTESKEIPSASRKTSNTDAQWEMAMRNGEKVMKGFHNHMQ
jgi:hypothetical protein